ncbi:PEGA domain-containing protein [Vibrio vulnificus]|uniref:PEGA domain-containing protein n=1 Tax=Vibrio vulnificus TaxID=672 RepID=UPI0005035C71|nr:PEGA domain-containing protein [Vibrio vulnificus]KFK53732.1 hypothetical protein JS86_17145 [Vibrio vulnificus]
MEKLNINTQKENLDEIFDLLDKCNKRIVALGQKGSGKSWLAQVLYENLEGESKLFSIESTAMMEKISEIEYEIESIFKKDNFFNIILDFADEVNVEIIKRLLNYHVSLCESYNGKHIALIVFTSNNNRKELSKKFQIHLVDVKKITSEESEFFFRHFIEQDGNRKNLKHLKYLYKKTDHSPGAILELSRTLNKKKKLLRRIFSSAYNVFFVFFAFMMIIMFLYFDLDNLINSKNVGKYYSQFFGASSIEGDSNVDKNNIESLAIDLNDGNDNSLEVLKKKELVKPDGILGQLAPADSVSSMFTFEDEGSSFKEIETEKKLETYSYQENSVKTNIHNNNEVEYFDITIRSNQYDDRVYIDGEYLGSTPLSVRLRKGSYDLKISKEGFENYKSDLVVKSEMTVFGRLRNIISINRFAEKIGGNVFGPIMINFSGFDGLFYDNMSISQRFITIGDFKRYIYSTGYILDSVHNGYCLDDGESYFNILEKLESKDYDEHPMSCVSINDALNYVRWLSNETGSIYRMPKKTELELFYLVGDMKLFFTKEFILSPEFYQNSYKGDASVINIEESLNQYTIDDKGFNKIFSCDFSIYSYNGCNEVVSKSISSKEVGFRVVREDFKQQQYILE